jgi:hypothetical protein
MPKCNTCGNNYEKCFEVVFDGKHYTFDSFECAIHALAPVCSHCGCRVIGHGAEMKGVIYCCHHCAEHSQHVGNESHAEGGLNTPILPLSSP